MRGVGGPLLTIGDLLSDLTIEGGDGPLVGVGDASAPSSPAASQQAEKADPFDLSQLFEVRKLEAYLISYWYKKWHKPIKHPLLPDARSIVKFDPYDD